MMGRVRPNFAAVTCTLMVFMFLLQFVNYDWNIFNFHILESREVSDVPLHDPLMKDSVLPKIIPPVDSGPGYNKQYNPNSENIAKITRPVDLRIIVITYNRPKSLLRLLNSLNEADYLNDNVVLEVWIDRSKTGELHGPTYDTAAKFNFQKGHKTVHNHTEHVGLYGQWIWTWQPKADTKEIAAILEDDLQVSPFYYRYLKKVHAKYDSKPEVNGYALQGISLKHGGGAGNLHAPGDNVVFLYPVLGSWGLSPKKENWIGFQKWFVEASKNKTFMPLVEGILPSLWYKMAVKKGEQDKIWTMWHIYYAYKNKERTLYPSFEKNKGLTINWRENGLHFSKALTVGDPLVTEWDTRLDNLPDEPIHLDAHGKVVDY